MDGWNTTSPFLLGETAYFQGLKPVSFREGVPTSTLETCPKVSPDDAARNFADAPGGFWGNINDMYTHNHIIYT